MIHQRLVTDDMNRTNNEAASPVVVVLPSHFLGKVPSSPGPSWPSWPFKNSGRSISLLSLPQCHGTVGFRHTYTPPLGRSLMTTHPFSSRSSAPAQTRPKLVLQILQGPMEFVPDDERVGGNQILGYLSRYVVMSLQHVRTAAQLKNSPLSRATPSGFRGRQSPSFVPAAAQCRQLANADYNSRWDEQTASNRIGSVDQPPPHRIVS